MVAVMLKSIRASAAFDEILRLARQGWRLFPCIRRMKRPAISAWPELATCDPVTLQRWALEHSGCNWGLACGPQSGVFILDIDGEAGRASLAALERVYGLLPHTLTALTGGGGEHRYFRFPPCDLRNSAGKLGAGLDTRASGGMVLVPPSTHPSGGVYRWANDAVHIAEAPKWFLDLLLAENSSGERETPQERSLLHEGQRNDGLARFAGALRRRGAELPELESRLFFANQRRCRPPLDAREVRQIAASAARYKIGGPDLLQTAWKKAKAKKCKSEEEKFLALCRFLQEARTDADIALPLQRIGELMGLHWTTVARYRKSAVQRGILTPTTQYVANARAGRYTYNEAKSRRGREPSAPLRPRSLGKTLTSGLVSIANHPSEHRSGNAPSERNAPSEHHSGELLSHDWSALDSDAKLALALARGESNGLTGAFLRDFVRRELELQRKWAANAARRKL